MMKKNIHAAFAAVRCCVLEHARSPFGLALLVLTAVLLFGVYQARLGHTVYVGVPTDDKPYVAGMHEPEELLGERYRWTMANSEVRLPGLGRGPYQLTLRLGGSANPQPAVRVTVNGWELARFDPAPLPSDYTFEVPAKMARDGDLIVGFESRTFRPADDPRHLGIALNRVTATPAGDPGLLLPPLTQALRLLAIVTVAYLLAAIAGFGPRMAAGGGAVVAVGLAAILVVNRPWLTIWSGQLLVAALTGLALTLLLRLALPAAYRLAGLRLGPGELRWPVALAALFFVIHFGGDLHPHIRVIDLGFHVNRYEDVHLRGKYLLLVKSREWGARETIYPSTVYFAMRPLGLITPSTHHTVLLFLALSEATRLCLVYLVARKATGDPRAGIFATTIFSVVPIAYLPFSWGIAANVFGAWCTTALFAILTLAYDKLRHPAVAGLTLVVTTLLFLSHPGKLALAAVTLAGAIGLFGIVARPRFRGSWPILVTIATLAGVAAFALVYRHAADDMLAKGWETVQGTASDDPTIIMATNEIGAARVWRVGGPVDNPQIGLTIDYVTAVPDLIVGGLAGFWREAVAYYYLWPPIMALIGLRFMRGGDDAARLRLTSLLWWGVAIFFALIGLLLNVYVRYANYLLPVIAIGAGLTLAQLSRAGRWGSALVVLLLAGTTIAGLWFWYLRISVDWH